MDWQILFNQVMTECGDISNEIIDLTSESDRLSEEIKEHRRINRPFIASAFTFITVFFSSAFIMIDFGNEKFIFFIFLGSCVFLACCSLILWLSCLKPDYRYHKKMYKGISKELKDVQKRRKKLVLKDWKPAKKRAHKLLKNATYEQLNNNDNGIKYDEGVLKLDNLFLIATGRKSKPWGASEWLTAASIAVGVLGIVASAASIASSASRDFGRDDYKIIYK